MSNFNDKKWSVGMLFLGTILGISGSLVANFFDRRFAHFGIWYDVTVAALFILILWKVDKFFENIFKK